MTTATFVDVEGAVRSWLRSHPLVTQVAGSRVYFGMPEGSPATPLVVLSRIGGSNLGGEAPLEDARISFAAWGGTKKSAFDAAAAVANALVAMDSEALDGSVFGYGATVDSLVWVPDPASGTPRYVVDATITVRAAGNTT